MIFDGKILSEISNDEICLLVKEHQEENQHLEYKLTINYKENEEKFEVLCDIVSLANAGGGYLIVGVRDDGRGKAQRFESVVEPERIIQSVQSLCIDYITERIEGIEFKNYEINSSNIVVIRIPQSLKMPHMVSYQNHTRFLSRYDTGKREMSIGEIRSMFVDSINNRRLSNIEDGVKLLIKELNAIKEERIEKKMKEDPNLPVSSITDGAVFLKWISERNSKEIDLKPYFEISIIPKLLTNNLVNVEDQDIISLIENPPNQREGGWNMEGKFSSMKRVSEGWIRTFSERQKLLFFQNGYMSFYTLLDGSTFYWNQPEDEYKKNPWLYPYAVVEYPLSFLKLYKEIISSISFKGELIITMKYRNINNHILLPFSPGKLGYMTRRSEPYNKEHLVIPQETTKEHYSPDLVTFNLIKYVYNTFGYTEDKIPFYNKELEKFIIE